MRLRGVWLALLAAPLLEAQFDPKAPLPEGVVTLARVRNAAHNTLRQIPNYTCTMTVERSQRRPGSRRFELLDNLRFEVALVDGRELFSWPGAERFEERDITELAGQTGLIGNGEFAGHARAVLLGSGSQFKYAGVDERDGRRLHRFDFLVPRELSGYTLRIGKAEGQVGYHGTVWADAESFELRRLDLVVDDVPPSIPLKEGVQSILYGRGRIGERQFLLPVSAEVTFTQASGLESRNRTSFSRCRQYAGESTLIFDDPPEDESPPPPPVISWKLPANLRLELRAAADVDLRAAAVGDLVEFDVVRDASMKRELWLGKGARVRARIADLHCMESPLTGCFVALRLEDFRFDNKAGAVRAELEMPLLRASARLAVGGGQAVLRALPPRLYEPPRDVGLMYFQGLRVPSGYATVWRTLELRE